MSAAGQSLLEEFRKLPIAEQQKVLHELLQLTRRESSGQDNLFPTIRLKGGQITSEQVAEALDDE